MVPGLCAIAIFYSAFSLPASESLAPVSIATVATVVGLLVLIPISRDVWDEVLTDRVSGPILERDTPIDRPQQATAALGDVATRLSHLLRNGDTSVPLTVAITGKWGSGKSSLMSMVQRNVSDAGFPCVWFNAWHHQRETHLFAALMETIRCGVEQWSSGPYIAFRLRVALTRIGQERFRFAVFIVMLLVLVIGAALALVSLVEEEYSKSIRLALSFLATYPVVRGYRFFGRVFGVASIRGAFKLTRFRDQLGFRHEFGMAFGQVCEAFGNRRLVIVVDDLDRCRPEQVVTILEAVNFLTSSGECVVLLGMDESRVKQAVSLYSSEVAVAATSSDGNGKDARQRYAERYLEKLIGLRIPVPAVTGEELHAVRR